MQKVEPSSPGTSLVHPEHTLTCSPLSPLPPFCPGSPISPCRTRKNHKVTQSYHIETWLVMRAEPSPVTVVEVSGCGDKGWEFESPRVPARRELERMIHFQPWSLCFTTQPSHHGSGWGWGGGGLGLLASGPGSGWSRKSEFAQPPGTNPAELGVSVPCLHPPLGGRQDLQGPGAPLVPGCRHGLPGLGDLSHPKTKKEDHSAPFLLATSFSKPRILAHALVWGCDTLPRICQ